MTLFMTALHKCSTARKITNKNELLKMQIIILKISPQLCTIWLDAMRSNYFSVGIFLITIYLKEELILVTIINVAKISCLPFSSNFAKKFLLLLAFPFSQGWPQRIIILHIFLSSTILCSILPKNDFKNVTHFKT